MRTHWTISALKQYERCPQQYAWTYVDPKPREGGEHPALARGTAIHADLEEYLTGRQERLEHPEISPIWHAMAEVLRGRDPAIEDQWELDDQWSEGGPLWLRMRIDAWTRDSDDKATVIDFKTGGVYPENLEQIEVYSVAAFGRFDWLQQVTGELWYIDHGIIEDKTFKRDDAGKLARKWENRAGILLSDREFRTSPGRHCRWCPYRESCPDAE
jgi:RecB family exonuclease